jgi:hypothetical protein
MTEPVEKSKPTLHKVVNRAFELATADRRTFQGLPVALLSVFMTVGALVYVFVILPRRTLFRVALRWR